MAGGRPAARFIEVQMFGNTGPLQEANSSSKLGGSSKDTYTYDWSGQDIVQKRGEELSGLMSSKAGLLHSGDIQGMLATGRRIADLKGYIDAYAATGGAGGMYGGAYGEVAPGRRVASESHETSSDMGGASGVTFHNPLSNTHKPREQ